MSFQFRYQRVLDVRELEEDQTQVEFADVQNRLNKEKQSLNELQEQLEEHYDRSRAKRDQFNRPGQLQLSHEHTQTLLERIEEQQEVVEKWEQKLEDKREQLVEASKKRQVMERLREQELEKFQEDVLDQERQENNEMAIRMHQRQQEES